MPTDEERIENLIDVYEDLLSRGERVDLSELCHEFPDLETMVRNRIERLQQFNNFVGWEPSSLATEGTKSEWTILGNAPLPAGRYRPARFHARGALGEVFFAHDEELDRTVVLKRINERQSRLRENCRRFEAEARITGQLEHPGVVPVYGLGHDADGKPVYAMRFIDGQTLADAIENFHQASGKKIQRTNVEFLQLLQRFVSLCQTVAYAHSRGIIHRDIKPANVMLGRFGETLLVDWGLAKHLSHAEETMNVEGKPPQNDDLGGTEIGVVKGSPAYMSPEQAEGRWDLVGVSSDIYSLGASLFHLLTGCRPFSGATTQVIRQVRRGELKRPRDIHSAIPVVLEAICMKAMNREINERYVDALEFAADLERWIADEKVLAYEEPWFVFGLRWLRRNRTLVTAISAAAFVLLLSLIAANVLLSQKNRQLTKSQHAAEQALRQTELERSKAENTLEQSLAAIHSMLLRVGRDEVAEIPEMQGIRREMLEDAVLFLQGFIGFEDRPNLVREQALAYQYLGKVQALLGEQTDAIASFKLAIDRQETIVELSPREFDSIQNLGLSWHELGRNQIFSNPIEAEKALLRSVELIKSLEGKLNGFELSLAETCNQLGTLYSNTSRPEQAAEMYRKSIQIRETFLKSASEPQDKDFFRRQLAQAHHNLGSLLLVRSNLSAAETEIRKADDLLSAEPEDSVMRRSFRNSRFEVCNSLATLLFDKGQLNDAVTQYERALAIAKERASLYPNIAEYKDSIARSHHNLANVYMTMQRKSDTLKEFQAATDIRRPLAQSHSDDAYQQTVFAETCAGLAHALSWNGKLDEANSSFREAMDALEGLVNKHPNMTRYIASLNSTEINYGLMLASIGDVTESLAAHQRVIDRAKAALQKDSGNSTMRLTLFNAHGARANTLISQQRFKEAIVNCDGVVDSASENEREFYIAWRLPTLARVDDHRAFQDVIQLAESGEKSAEVYYNLSCACAIAIQTMKNRTLDDTAKSDLESKYRTKAFEMLENTISQGFFTNPDSKEFLDNDSDFDELRKDARWQEFEQRISHAIENSNPAPRP